MRLIKVSAPAGMGEKVAQTAFSAGIEKVSLYKTESLQATGARETKDTVDIETSTPLGKRFVDALLDADFYDKENFSLAVRQPRAIVSSEKLEKLTVPLVEPATDMLEELWQFSHVTLGFVGRILIASCLLAYGLIQQQILLIIAGLLFLPLLPTLLAVSFGVLTKNFRLAGKGLLAFAIAVVLLIAGGAAIAAFNSPPLKYSEFNSLPVGALISLAVGVAGALASFDDVGRRELIGLAATAQIAIVPVWFGISFVFGFSPLDAANEITTRAVSFFLNVLIIIVAALATYFLFGIKSRRALKSD
jgi:hypothetical protein